MRGLPSGAVLRACARRSSRSNARDCRGVFTSREDGPPSASVRDLAAARAGDRRASYPAMRRRVGAARTPTRLIRSGDSASIALLDHHDDVWEADFLPACLARTALRAGPSSFSVRRSVRQVTVSAIFCRGGAAARRGCVEALRCPVGHVAARRSPRDAQRSPRDGISRCLRPRKPTTCDAVPGTRHA